ncbi:type II secretion system F family protein [Actinoplanes sp. NPDC051475]|uniref:type II secretion system F family protein n=1 Tax=Actinoplanes sp. NPDC051475 TaxID=3157225 RepID=UPI00344B1CCD
MIILSWTVIAVGVLAGAGIWLLLLALFPPRPRLQDELAALRPRPVDEFAVDYPAAEALDTAPGWVTRLGRPAVRWLSSAGLPPKSVRTDLAVLGRSAEALLAESAAAGLIGLLLPFAVTLVFAAVGIGVNLTVPVLAALAMAGVMFAAPMLSVRTAAAKHRAEFRQALSAFFDLVVVALAGGSGVEEAMNDAAAVGTGAAFADLRHALAEAYLTGTPPWTALGRLGRRAGIDELEELANAIGLAGTEGARVRASLQSRAMALRGKQLAEAEAAASSATERMGIPIVAMSTGFLMFIGFPAAYGVMATL